MGPRVRAVRRAVDSCVAASGETGDSGAGGVGRRRAVRRVEGARGAVARVVGVERAERRGVEADILREEVGPVAEAKVRERARDGLSEREDDERARRVERGASPELPLRSLIPVRSEP